MHGTCANPACSTPFYKLSGKFFLIKTATDMDISGGKPPVFAPIPHREQYFWLCDSCAETLQVVYDPARGIRVEPLPEIPDVADPVGVERVQIKMPQHKQQRHEK
jgi:hypothetical protein